jgi:hypothetical protein
LLDPPCTPFLANAQIMGWQRSFIYSLIGAILFSLLIVYDTFMLSKKLSPDEVGPIAFSKRDATRDGVGVGRGCLCLDR